MINPEIIGMLAGILTTVAFLPQVYRTWKLKSAKDLSLGMFLVFVTGIILWLIYGIIINNMPIIIANSFTLLFAGTLLYFKLFLYK